jgi:hypothetical protein
MNNVLSTVFSIKTASTTYCGFSSYNKTVYLAIKPNITELVMRIPEKYRKYRYPKISQLSLRFKNADLLEKSCYLGVPKKQRYNARYLPMALPKFVITLVVLPSTFNTL